MSRRVWFATVHLRTLLLHLFLVGAAMGFAHDVVAGPPFARQAAGGAVLGAVFEVPKAGKAMSLTINVDWGEEHLPAMLDAFHRHGARVTFFLTGAWARQHPELVRALVEAGHEVGNHGLTHAHPKSLSSGAFRQHVEGNTALLDEILGQRSARLYAPPYGEWDRRIVRQAAALGYPTILWTLDTIDWQDPDPQTITERVVPRARDGAIVLMHPRANTVAALEPMLSGLAARGFELVSVGELLRRGGES